MGWMCVPCAPQVAQPSSQHQEAAPESRNANCWAIAVNMHFFPLHIPQLFAYFLSTRKALQAEMWIWHWSVPPAQWVLPAGLGGDTGQGELVQCTCASPAPWFCDHVLFLHL